MPTVTHTFTWDSNNEGFSAGLGGFGTWTGADGSDFLGNPAPGCMDLQNNISQGNWITKLVTWETLGVPHGATVTAVSARMRWKWISIGAPLPTNLYVVVRVQSSAPFSQEPLWSQNHEGDTPGSWMTLNGSTVSVPAGNSASSFSFEIRVEVGASAWGGGTWEAHADTLEFTVTYLGGPVPIVITPRGASRSEARALVVNRTPRGGGVGGIRGPAHSYVTKPKERNRAAYMGHGFWGKKTTPAPTPVCALWKAYTKGFVSGEDMSIAAFGLPTEFLVCGPLTVNEVFTVQKLMVDPNGAAAGVPMIFKMERDATDADNTDKNPQSLIAIELIYDKA